MVDEIFQDKGIGKAATKLMISEVRKLPCAQRIVVGFHLENQEAHHLYTSIGFIDNGNRFGREMAAIKYLNE